METGKIKLMVGEVTPENFADILKGICDGEIQNGGFGIIILGLSDPDNTTEENPGDEPEDVFECEDDIDNAFPDTDDGYDDGFDDGFDDGYDEGFEIGYCEGYHDGYMKAKKEAENNG